MGKQMDRHSRVVTARGERDRRIRLAIPTALGLYDIQDRLGFDKPSLALEWLLHVAKSSIDHLNLNHASSSSSSSTTQSLPSPHHPPIHAHAHTATLIAITATQQILPLDMVDLDLDLLLHLEDQLLSYVPSILHHPHSMHEFYPLP